MTPDANDLCVFAVKRGNIESRIDPHFYLPFFQDIISRITANPHTRLGQVATFSKETTDYSEFPESSFEYLEISGVSLGTNEYQTTTADVANAPSRARMRTQIGDIVISLTRPHRGAIAIIHGERIIASTGFAIIRNVIPSVDKKWLLYTLLSNICLNQMLQRSSGGNYPAIIEEELKRILIPQISQKKQLLMAAELENKLHLLNTKLQQADELVEKAKENILKDLGIVFQEYQPSIYSHTSLTQIREIGLFCNPHSAYLADVFSVLKSSPMHVGKLEDYVVVNPVVDRRTLLDETEVSFVPMPNVYAKENRADYILCSYSEVKTGFTPFKKGDLLWAKITPCMQNGKSFLASDMQTEYGFGSTEFHVLRARSNQIYMPFLWILLSEKHILEAAQGMFSGSAGQQRVPDLFLKKFPLVLPEFEKQRELADSVLAALKESRRIRQEAEREWDAAKAWFERELLKQ